LLPQNTFSRKNRKTLNNMKLKPKGGQNNMVMIRQSSKQAFIKLLDGVMVVAGLPRGWRKMP
jgi:hypothetical protein